MYDCVLVMVWWILSVFIMLRKRKCLLYFFALFEVCVIRIISKTRIFKYIENFTTKKKFFFSKNI